MIHSLYRRLALMLLLVFVTLGGLLFWLYENSNQSLQRETAQKLHLNLASYLVQEVVLFEDDKLDLANIKQAFNKIMMLDPATELYVIDTLGKVITYDAPAEKIIRTQVDVRPVKTFLGNKDALPILGDDPRTDKRKIFSAAPIMDNDKDLLGYLYVIINGEAYDTVATALRTNKTWWKSISLMSTALVFLLITTLLLFNRLTRPLIQLNKEVAAFETSKFTTLPKEAGLFFSKAFSHPDEFQQLRGSIYRMEKQIIDQLGALKKHDAQRSEFLAHLSHDLRTPLAGAQAYLETLQLKGSDISGEVRDDYLQKSLRSISLLSKMIDELFDFARLEYGDIEIHPELTSLSDLLSDMVAVLGRLASDNDITLTIKLENEGQRVFADVARLDRILQNLIANAIKYTPKSGTVTVDAISHENSHQVEIIIRDSGVGISKDDIGHITEPYFRCRPEDKRTQEGSGLGLAIAARLLALHGSQLEISSELNQGTTFSFKLNAKADNLKT